MAQAFQDLLVWQRSIELCAAVYGATAAFPKEEMYGLTSQLRRASVSVASNIAEGRGRLTQGEFRQFLGNAQGSNYEVQTQIVIARRLGFGSRVQMDVADQLSVEVGKMLSSLIASIQLKAKS
jgi:four helix bundle protein